MPGKWFRLDSSFIPSQKIELLDSNDREGRFRKIKELFDVPEGFFKPDSKVIYYSLGSMASGYRKINHHFINLISNVPEHRFIVSKGPLGDEIELPSNCIGGNFVNQFEILKVCGNSE